MPYLTRVLCSAYTTKTCTITSQIFVSIGTLLLTYAMVETDHTHHQMQFKDILAFWICLLGFLDWRNYMMRRWRRSTLQNTNKTWSHIKSLLLAQITVIQIYCVLKGQSINPINEHWYSRIVFLGCPTDGGWQHQQVDHDRVWPSGQEDKHFQCHQI